VIGTILLVFYVIACVILILFVLLQPGKSDAAAVFGGGANTSAFGPRGTATVLAKVTIGAAIVFFFLAFLFSIPGVFESGSVAPSEAEPATSAPAPVTPESPLTPQPAATPTEGNSNQASPAQPSGAGNANR
jgi:preprotein translocase subunit SecG